MSHVVHVQTKLTEEEIKAVIKAYEDQQPKTIAQCNSLSWRLWFQLLMHKI